MNLQIWKLEILYYLGSENKGADETARMHRLICTFVGRIWHKQVFSWRGANSTEAPTFTSAQFSSLPYRNRISHPQHASPLSRHDVVLAKISSHGYTRMRRTLRQRCRVWVWLASIAFCKFGGIVEIMLAQLIKRLLTRLSVVKNIALLHVEIQVQAII